VPSLYPPPAESAMQSIFAGLVAATTQVSRTQAGDPERDATGVFAEWITDGDDLAVLGFADHKTVNFLGGAMMSLEPEPLTEDSDKGVLNADSVEGFQEVLNVLASSLNTDFTPHLRLRKVVQLPGQLDDDVKQLWREPRGRRAYQVNVDGFGEGTLIVYLG
jgi:hypothetical protein